MRKTSKKMADKEEKEKMCVSKKSYKKAFKMLVILVFFIGLVCQPAMTAMAANTKRSIRYNNKTYMYTKSKVNIVVDDLAVSTPFGGLILDNVSMVPAYYVFKKSSLENYYEYNSSKKVLTIENLEHSIEFPIGKKYAYVDGVKTTMEHPAVFVKDMTTKKTCLMVPCRFTVEALGYSYTWDNSSVTSYIAVQDENDSDLDDSVTDNDENSGTVDSDDMDSDSVDQDSNQDNESTDTNQGDIPEKYAVKIPTPEALESYTEEDNYWKKQYIIDLDDDYSDFYEDITIQKNQSNIKKISVGENEDGNTEIVITTNKIQAFRVTKTDDALYVEAGDPKSIYEKVIVVDAGHGGSDTGTTGNGVIEKNTTLAIAKEVKKNFDQDTSFKVYYTRLTDSVSGMTAGSSGVSNAQMSLPARYNLANEVNADLFISIHVNSYPYSSNPNGTETYYSTKNTNKNDWGITSKSFATKMQNAIQPIIGRTNRGVKSANYAVLYHTNMPAILIETAFASNKQDAAILKNSNKIAQIGQAIYEVTAEAFE